MAGIGEGEAAGVTQHVRVSLEIEAGLDAGTLDHLGEAGRRESQRGRCLKQGDATTDGSDAPLPASSDGTSTRPRLDGDPRSLTTGPAIGSPNQRGR
jgi:hypothetical protein